MQRSFRTPTQAKVATLSVLPIQLKLWQKGFDLSISTARSGNIGADWSSDKLPEGRESINLLVKFLSKYTIIMI